MKEDRFSGMTALSGILCVAAAAALMCAQARASDYDVISVGNDPTQDDGAISITEDDDSTTIHMGGDPDHGIYHNPSQQNEYVCSPDGWRDYGGGSHMGSGWEGRGQGGQEWDGDGRMHHRNMHGRGQGPDRGGYRYGPCTRDPDDCGYGN